MISRFVPRFGWIKLSLHQVCNIFYNLPIPFASSESCFLLMLWFSLQWLLRSSMDQWVFLKENQKRRHLVSKQWVLLFFLANFHHPKSPLQAYVPTIIRNWCVLTAYPQWHLLISLFRGVYIPTQLINFSIVPPHLRFFTVSVVSLFWSKRLTFCHSTIY